MLTRTRKVVEDYLRDNLDVAVEIAKQLNSWDGSFEWAEQWDFDELCQFAADNGADAVGELVRAAVNGSSYGGMVRYNGYGNLEPAEDEDLQSDANDYMDDILDALEELIDEEGEIDNDYKGCFDDDAIDDIANSVYVTVKINNIEYDISVKDFESEEEYKEELENLPKELVLDEIHVMEYNNHEEVDTDEISERISDETGWCVVTYQYEIMQ